jgi:hypothetical protein
MRAEKEHARNRMMRMTLSALSVAPHLLQTKSVTVNSSKSCHKEGTHCEMLFFTHLPRIVKLHYYSSLVASIENSRSLDLFGVNDDADTKIQEIRKLIHKSQKEVQSRGREEKKSSQKMKTNFWG